MPADRKATEAAIAAGLAGLRAGEADPMARALRAHLRNHVMPFWEKHAWEEPTGSLCTCIGDDGAVRSRDKWMWSQWRAVWVFSRLHRTMNMGGHWLEGAQRIAAFCGRHGWMDRDGGWALVLSGDGEILRGHESTYTDAFAVYGLAELHRAAPSKATEAVGRRSADAALRQLACPYDTLPHFPYPVPVGAKPHGVPMMWSLVLAEAGEAFGESRYLAAAGRLADETMRDFRRREDGMMVELVGLDGSPWPPPRGTAVVPGHAIESMWFQLRALEILGGNPARKAEALQTMRCHLEFGWDRTHGGLLLARDADGRTDVGWDFADLKLWWPHTEALYGVLLAWSETGDNAWLEWYGKLWSVCLAHFVDWEHGEWRQKLNRDLTPWEGVVALPVKDPFHLPRSLILQIELLERMTGRA
jgi:N-acylglucosamine 2-epimerase